MACDKDGNTRDRCWTLVGYPPSRNPRPKTQPSILGQPPSRIYQTAVTPSASSPIPGLSLELYQKLFGLLAPSSSPIKSSVNFIGFRQYQADHSLFTLVTHTSITIVLMIVSLGAGPCDALFGGGNIPAFVLASVSGFVAGVIAIRRLPNISSGSYKSSGFHLG
ncbi:sucrose transport protein-like [Juglans microcarpa x Juglans regia]|uniref:sucrose transport protein-like n=1 Tax=Juglans microcarpa x Juglans regia TaxID=2249226 RepID=UPI001B7E904C|nr:sucrose transport protein-like [Juglans microcarpa x Juglans regia]